MYRLATVFELGSKKPVHRVCRVRQKKRYSVFEIRAAVTPDLDRKFLVYGANVEVLGPSSYRERFTEIVDAMYKIYHKGE